MPLENLTWLLRGIIYEPAINGLNNFFLELGIRGLSRGEFLAYLVPLIMPNTELGCSWSSMSEFSFSILSNWHRRRKSEWMDYRIIWRKNSGRFPWTTGFCDPASGHLPIPFIDFLVNGAPVGVCRGGRCSRKRQRFSNSCIPCFLCAIGWTETC